MKLLEGDKGKKLVDVGLSNAFWMWHPKHKQQNKKTSGTTSNWKASAKESASKVKRLQNGKKKFANYIGFNTQNI